jgi:hypothetical protein
MALPCAVKGCAAGVLLAALAGPSEAPAQPVPVGPEFQVNTYTTGYQGYPAVAADADGDFVVVWRSKPFSPGTPITSDWRIQGQRYDSAGSALGSQFQVNTNTTNIHSSPSVAAEADGDFLVMWEHNGLPPRNQGQRYDSTGSAVGSQLQDISTRVAMDADGDLVDVWSALDWPAYSMQGQRYDSAGTAVGSQFQVNTSSDDRQGYPAVAAHADGDFVVAWWSTESNYSIQGRRYDSAGSAVGGQFQISTFPPPASFTDPTVAVAVEADHDFVVVWDSIAFGESWNVDDPSSFGVQGRRYDSAGSAVGDVFQVNTYTTGSQKDPSVAATADGGFVVVWRSSESNETSNTSVRGQHYDSAGNAVGGEFPVSTYTTARTFRPSVAAGANGDFVVAWETYVAPAGDTSYASVHARRFTIAAAVPSLSPAGIAAAALLLCLAVALALRRRV